MTEEKDIGWMYQGAKALVNREDYLLGKKIDKSFEKYSDAVNEEKPEALDALLHTRTVVKPQPSTVKTSALETYVVATEDPLVAVKVKEETRRREVLENPLMKLKFQKMLKEMMAEKEGKGEKKKKKKKKKKDSSREEKPKKIKKKKSRESKETKESREEASISERRKSSNHKRSRSASSDSEPVREKPRSRKQSEARKSRERSPARSAKKERDQHHDKSPSAKTKRRQKSSSSPEGASRRKRRGSSSSAEEMPRKRHTSSSMRERRQSSIDRDRGSSPRRRRRLSSSAERTVEKRRMSRSPERRRRSRDRRRSSSPCRNRSFDRSKDRIGSSSRRRSMSPKRERSRERKSRKSQSRSRSKHRSPKRTRRHSESSSASPERRRERSPKRSKDDRLWKNKKEVHRSSSSSSSSEPRRRKSRSPTRKEKTKRDSSESPSTSSSSEDSITNRKVSPKKDKAREGARAYSPSNVGDRKVEDSKDTELPGSSREDTQPMRSFDTHIPEHLRPKAVASDSDEEIEDRFEREERERKKRFEGFGLVEVVKKPKDDGPTITQNPYELSRKPTAPVYQKPEHRRPLTEEEKQAKLQEMTQNAIWRQETRKKNLKRARLVDEQEEVEDSQDKAPSFIRSQLNTAVADLSVEQRLQSNKRSLQRSEGGRCDIFGGFCPEREQKERITSANDQKFIQSAVSVWHPREEGMWGSVLLLVASTALAADVSDWKTGEVTGEVVEGKRDFPCYSLSRDNYTCGACIQLHDSCAWCGAPLFDAKKQYARCDNRARLLEHGCPESYIEDPQTVLEVEKDEPLSDKGQVENEDDAVQLKPQEMFVEIRPKSRVRFNVTYRQAVDYPVDLYYLMDLSYSMKDDKQKLSELGDLLAVRMRNITKNFRLGFGSFIDKKLMPFIDPRIEKQKSPCAEPCAEPYGFKHQMTLTTNTEKFKAEVDKAEISGNLDAPEGGFDAVVQALACNSKIGWRERARKMLVFSTDAGFHFAGDGRLAGVVEPNDGECHLDRDGYYTETLKQDYPSIALLHQMIKDRKANIIFAVTKGNHELYTQLSESLPDVSSSVGILETDSRNIVDLIEKEYLKISEKIIMVDNANASDGLKMTYRSMCLDGTTLRDTNVCEGIRVGDEVQFEVTLEATHCVDKRDFVLRIGPSGLDETLIVNVKVLCDCDCEQEDRIVENAEECHGGDQVCGVCRCKGGNVGRYCECNRPGMSTAALNEKCKRTNESAICEGRGVCNCGRCECNPRQNPEEQISGEFCECDNFNCPRHDRKICAEHGECNCGQCICAPGWTGRACECPISQDSCMSANGKICNGKGECICGRCRCFDGPDGNRYSGAKCEICPTCPTKCIEYKPCVMCQQWGTGPYDEERCKECPFTVIPVEELPELNETTACQFVDPADDCTFYYLYYYDEATDNATVWVREHKDCPPPVPVLAIVLGVIAGIVILGLILLLVWKLLTVLHDRAEYAKFNNERLMAKWDTNENPIYKQATTTFRNPVYAGNKNKGL